MKNLKKLSGILLAIAVLLACTVSAFAVSSPTTKGSITIKNATQTYRAYKIFDVTFDGNKYAYTITSAPDGVKSPWFQTVKTYAETLGSGLKIEGPVSAANGEKFFNVTFDGSFNEGAFSNALKTALDGGSITDSGTSVPITDSDGKIAYVNDLDLGYYFVTTSVGTVMNLTTTNKDATVYDKNYIPFTKSDKGATTVQFGDTVNFEIKGEVPDTTGFEGDYVYLITDTMDKGLTYKNDIAVKVGENSLDADKYIVTLPTGSETFTFKLQIKVDQLQTNDIGKEILVTYSATANKNTVADISKNVAKLEYSNNPSDASDTTSKTATTSVYSAQIVIDKLIGDTSDKLQGAKFVLTDATQSKYYHQKGDGSIEWVTIPAESTLSAQITANKITEVTTDGSGAATFDGLKNGTYYLVETYTPDGYNLLKAATEVEVDGTANDADVADAVADTLVDTATIRNYSGTELPSTGGIGTTIFYIVGGVLVAAAVVLLVAKKRTSENR